MDPVTAVYDRRRDILMALGDCDPPGLFLPSWVPDSSKRFRVTILLQLFHLLETHTPALRMTLVS